MNKKKSKCNERPPSVFYLSDESLLSFEDLTSLPYLYDDTVVECITARYKKDYIYTWAGPILVALNPFRTIDGLYSLQHITEIFNILKDGHDHQDPHVFTVAGLAHKRLISEIGLVNQAILVSGESGAGKTESAKLLLTYLTQVETEASAGSPLKGVWKGQKPEDIQKRILASNPILEAFGNAATLRNHNSSRFGKLVRLQYNNMSLKGAMMDTYLLEKTRVTNQPIDERNFHIFYQLLAGIRNGFVPDLEIKKDINFSIVPGLCNRDFEKDLTDFKETMNAFREVGISDVEEMDVYRVVAAIMYLGNVSFELSSDKETWTIGSDEGTQDALNKSSQLLSLPVETLIDAFTMKIISVTSGKNTTVFNKPFEREDQCKERRNALMQLLYLSVFSYLVTTINSKTSVESSLCSNYLGILDIYGFEAFDENSLEQLCINYTNERLQQEFTRRYIASEHKLLSEEGFMDFPFVYRDNARCVKALDSPISVFAILNEECQLKRALNESEACERVCNVLQDTGVVTPFSSSRKKSGFLVKHYAGNVNYASSGLLQKNKDELPQDIVGLLIKSSNEFVIELSQGYRREEKEREENPNRKGVRKVTTLSKFKSSLDALINILTACDLHYVRCLKPNNKNIAESPDKIFLLDQLNSNGILETVKISQAGYPVRMYYPDFVKRYNLSRMKHNFDDKEITFNILLEIIGSNTNDCPPEDKCRFGKTRIFLSENCLHLLEEYRNVQKNLAATCIQKNIKRYIVQKWYSKTRRAIILLQRRFVGFLHRLRYLRMRKAAICIQKDFKCHLQKQKYRKILDSVILIQKYWRGWLCRKKYVLLKRSRFNEAIRPVSRISGSSSGYGSYNPMSLTDYSASDAETVTEESLRVGRRLFETEESGIETDTESLSGEGLKSGRASRLRSRHNLAQFRARQKGSDDDITDSPSGKSEKDTPQGKSERRDTLSGKSERRESSRSHLATSFHHSSPFKTENLKTRSPIISPKNRSPLDGYSRRSKGAITPENFADILETVSWAQEFQLNLSPRNVTLFYKDGVLSCRVLKIGKVKFHTRSTCLPYSTCVPFNEKPQGLFDIVR